MRRHDALRSTIRIMQDGTIDDRGNGTISVRLYVPSPWGEPKRVRRTLRLGPDATDDDKRAAVDALKTELGITAAEATVATVLGAYWTENYDRWGQREQASIRTIIDQILIPHLGHHPAAALTFAHLETFYRHMQRDRVGCGICATNHHVNRPIKNIGGGYIRRLHGIINPAFADAQRAGWRTDNPAALVRLRRFPLNAEPTPALPLAAIKAYLAHASELDDQRLYAHLRLSAYTGARPGETAALQRDDFALVNGQPRLTISRALSEFPRLGGPYPYGQGSGMIVKGTKTGDERVLSIDRDTYNLALSLDYPDGWLFYDDVSETPPPEWNGSGDHWPHRPRWWTRRFYELRDRAGSGDHQLRALRHSHFTQLLDGGFRPGRVKERSGHRQEATLTNVYAHGTYASDDADMAAYIARILG